MTVYNINNLEIVANHQANATTNVENTDTESVNKNNINTAETEIDKKMTLQRATIMTIIL